MKKIVLDTNVYIDWLNRGLHETVMLGPGLVRYLSAVVVMELRAGVSHRASRDAVDALTRHGDSPHLAARRLLALDHQHLLALRGKADRGGQAAHSSPYDDGSIP